MSDRPTITMFVVLRMMTNILRGAQERKKTAERRKSIIFVLLLLRALPIILEDAFCIPTFFDEARKTR